MSKSFRLFLFNVHRTVSASVKRSFEPSVEALGFHARLCNRSFDAGHLALILFQFLLCIGNIDRIRSSPTIGAEVFASSRIPSDEMFHGVCRRFSDHLAASSRKTVSPLIASAIA